MARFSDLYPTETVQTALSNEYMIVPGYRHPDLQDHRLIAEPELGKCARCGAPTRFWFARKLVDDPEEWAGMPLCSEECLDRQFASGDRE